MHNLFRGVILLSKLLCAPHILEYAAALNIIFPKNSFFIFRLCKRSSVLHGPINTIGAIDLSCYNIRSFVMFATLFTN
ncbi:hypothetical protein [Candidatus Sarmatiella mevalonica]|uniref:hypothetical protein n=1 Tax=Candidatus Sarmatiella mevalonica TaxID=2770581 RepID=UPI00192119BC|nr:hypothetical protein [Candidatus Sarmatiella mevalonica]